MPAPECALGHHYFLFLFMFSSMHTDLHCVGVLDTFVKMSALTPADPLPAVRQPSDLDLPFPGCLLVSEACSKAFQQQVALSTICRSVDRGVFQLGI